MARSSLGHSLLGDGGKPRPAPPQLQSCPDPGRSGSDRKASHAVGPPTLRPSYAARRRACRTRGPRARYDPRRLLERRKVQPAPLEISRPDAVTDELFAEPGATGHRLVAFVCLRLLALVYVVAFASLVHQGPALIGPDGLLPADLHLERLVRYAGGRSEAVLRFPSIFWWIAPTDGALIGVGWVGVVLAAFALLGFGNAVTWGILWVLHLSVLQIGQRWYWFGWESLLSEVGFLAIFLVPPLDPRPLSPSAPPRIVVWLLRWTAFRLMLGAGLIKLRGDPCWTDLTCLDFHFETQPNPHPASPYFHFLPHPVLAAGVLFTHFAEVVAPFGLFLGRLGRRIAGVTFVALQVLLIASGNLAYLNWLSLVPSVACLDDDLLARVLPGRLVRAAEGARARARPPGKVRRLLLVLVLAMVAFLSIRPVGNLLSRRQLMNASFDRFHLVNTYGAFGSVSRTRPELVVLGSMADDPDDETAWRPYEFVCKPTDPERRPCLVTPYHLRLDWLMWFAAMAEPADHPWLVHLVDQLLTGSPEVRGLLARDPFDGRAPRWIRIDRYVYRFAPLGSGRTWDRTYVGPFLGPVGREDPQIAAFLVEAGLRRPNP
ncbi:MAG: lipase maturation factor family protein [Deltaproteobacteria bacterium]|nr:MAG: lipase maturation factor family protein [Deltaproteobacteria bacterium]